MPSLKNFIMVLFLLQASWDMSMTPLSATLLSIVWVNVSIMHAQMQHLITYHRPSIARIFAFVQLSRRQSPVKHRICMSSNCIVPSPSGPQLLGCASINIWSLISKQVVVILVSRVRATLLLLCWSNRWSVLWSHLTFFTLMRFFYCSFCTDFKKCPCPPIWYWGSRVSGLV